MVLSEDYYDYHENDSWNYSYDDYHTVCEKEDVRSFARVFLPIMYALALVVGLAGNSLVVAVYVYYKKLRPMTDVYILNLAVADLLLLLTLPFWAADAVIGWELGQAMCKVTSALYSMNFSCGMLFLACVSVDRYLAVFHHTLGRTTRRRHCVWMCLLVWALAFVLGLPDLILSTVRQTPTRKTCMPVYMPSMARPTKAAMEVLEILLSFVLPFLVMLFCYSRVACTLLQVPQARQGKKWRAFRVLLAVVGVFIATQLPYNVVKFCRAMDVIHTLITHCEVSKSLDRAAQVTESLALTHSCLNPVLYAFIGASFSQHILRLAKGFSQGGRRQRRRQRSQEEPAIDMSLHSHTASQDTSTFTI